MAVPDDPKQFMMQSLAIAAFQTFAGLVEAEGSCMCACNVNAGVEVVGSFWVLGLGLGLRLGE